MDAWVNARNICGLPRPAFESSLISSLRASIPDSQQGKLRAVEDPDGLFTEAGPLPKSLSRQ